MVFQNLYMAQGTDASGVPSMFLTINSTLDIHFENRSKYVRARLNPLIVKLLYQDLPITIKKVSYKLLINFCTHKLLVLGSRFGHNTIT